MKMGTNNQIVIKTIKTLVLILAKIIEHISFIRISADTTLCYLIRKNKYCKDTLSVKAKYNKKLAIQAIASNFAGVK